MKENTQLLRDPLIRYGFFAGILLSTLCLAFTIVYLSTYYKHTDASFEAHSEAYLRSPDVSVLAAVLTARTAQNKVLLQSCGVVVGIAFGFLGFSLFLLGIQGDIQVDGTVTSHAFSLKRLTPGSLIMISALALVGLCAVHEIKFDLDLSKAAVQPQGFKNDVQGDLLVEHPNNDQP